MMGERHLPIFKANSTNFRLSPSMQHRLALQVPVEAGLKERAKTDTPACASR